MLYARISFHLQHNPAMKSAYFNAIAPYLGPA